MHLAGKWSDGVMRRVLVVDDDRSMVKTLCDVLAFKGWAVGNAYSGEQAVELAERLDEIRRCEGSRDVQIAFELGKVIARGRRPAPALLPRLLPPARPGGPPGDLRGRPRP